MVKFPYKTGDSPRVLCRTEGQSPVREGLSLVWGDEIMELTILEKSEYERLHHLIPDGYYPDLNAEKYFCVGLVENTGAELLELLGVAILEEMPDGIRLVWICATRAHLGKGFAKKLISALMDSLNEQKTDYKIYANFEIPDFENENEDKSLIAVYRALEESGFEISKPDCALYEVDCKKAFNLPIRSAKKGVENCIQIKKALSRQINEMLNKMREDSRGIPIPRLFNVNLYDRDISVLYCENNKVVGAFFVSTDDGENIEVNLAWSISKIALASMMICSIDLLEKKYPNAKKIFIPTVNDVSGSLVVKLFPDAKKVSGCHAVIKKTFEK